MPPTGKYTYKTVIGLCEPIIDINVTLPRGSLAPIIEECNIEDGVQFLDTDRYAELVKHLTENHRQAITHSAGGPVSNTLHAMGARMSAYPRPVRLIWRGPHHLDLSYRKVDPLFSLRQVGVRTECLDSQLQIRPGSVCFVDLETGEAAAIAVGPRTKVDHHAVPCHSNELCLIKLADLESLLLVDEEASGADFAVVTADHPNLQPEAIRRIIKLSEAGRIPFAFGKYVEFLNLGLLSEAPTTVLSFLRGTEVVATAGGEPVTIVPPDRIGTPHTSSVEMLRPSHKSFLGAGDAYAGGYLAARLTGSDSAAAHLYGLGEARLSSYSDTARRNYSANLTELFGSYIERSSPIPDWDLAGRIRQTAGLTIISCGQTGIDQLSLTTAQRWGLAAFAVMPHGRRTENSDKEIPDIDDLGDAHVIELGSSSYRYCTWANVFTGDGTLILDYAGSEGSEETRRACAALNRPTLELAGLDGQQVIAEIRRWIFAHGIRVIHVAGTRASALRPEDFEEASRILDTAIRVAASCYGLRSGRAPNTMAVEVPAPHDDRDDRNWKVGIPRLGEVRRAIENIVLDNHSSESREERRLTFEIEDGKICIGKSADLVAMLNRGVLDAAFVGSDMLYEQDRENIEIVALLGIFNTLLAVVAPNSIDFNPTQVVSQYPKVAKSYFRDAGGLVVPVAGSAESWVGCGAFDATVDTWRSGATAESNDLQLIDAIEATTLTFIVNKDKCSPSAFNLCERILEQLTLHTLRPDDEDVIERYFVRDGQ